MHFVKRKLFSLFAFFGAIIALTLLSSPAQAWTLQDYNDYLSQQAAIESSIADVNEEILYNESAISGLYEAYRVIADNCGSLPPERVAECQMWCWDGYDQEYQFMQDLIISGYSTLDSLYADLTTVNNILLQIRIALGLP